MVPINLLREAVRRGIKVPLPATLEKYGLDAEAWVAILAAQGWACPICGRESPIGKYVTDHEHVHGWAAMPPERRALYVRGVTCWTCNRYLLARGISVETAERTVTYLQRYAARRPEPGPKMGSPGARNR